MSKRFKSEKSRTILVYSVLFIICEVLLIPGGIKSFLIGNLIFVGILVMLAGAFFLGKWMSEGE